MRNFLKFHAWTEQFFAVLLCFLVPSCSQSPNTPQAYDAERATMEGADANAFLNPALASLLPPPLTTDALITSIKTDPVLSTIYSSLTAQIADLNSKFKKLSSKLNTEVTNRTNAVSNLQKSTTDQINFLQGEITTLNQNVEILAGYLGADMVDAINGLSGEISTNQKSSMTVQQHLTELDTEYGTLNDDMNSMANGTFTFDGKTLQGWKENIFQTISTNYTSALMDFKTAQTSDLKAATASAKKDITKSFNSTLNPILTTLTNSVNALSVNLTTQIRQESGDVQTLQNSMTLGLQTAQNNLNSGMQNLASSIQTEHNSLTAYATLTDSKIKAINATLTSISSDLTTTISNLGAWTNNGNLTGTVSNIQTVLTSHLEAITQLQTQASSSTTYAQSINTQLTSLVNDVNSFPSYIQTQIETIVQANPVVAQLTSDLTDSNGKIQSINQVIQAMMDNNFTNIIQPYVQGLQSSWISAAENKIADDLKNSLAGAQNDMSVVTQALNSNFVGGTDFAQFTASNAKVQNLMQTAINDFDIQVTALYQQTSAFKTAVTSDITSIVQQQTYTKSQVDYQISLVNSSIAAVPANIQTNNAANLLTSISAKIREYNSQMSLNFATVNSAIQAAQQTITSITNPASGSANTTNNGLGNVVYAATQYQALSQSYQQLIQQLFQNLCQMEDTPQVGITAKTWDCSLAGLSTDSGADFATAYTQFKNAIRSDAGNLSTIQTEMVSIYNLLSSIQNEMNNETLVSSVLANRTSALEAQAQSMQSQLNGQAQELASLKASVSSNALSLGQVFQAFSPKSGDTTANFAQTFASQNSAYADAYTQVAADQQLLVNGLNPSAIQKLIGTQDINTFAEQMVTLANQEYTAFTQAYSTLYISLWKKLTADPTTLAAFNNNFIAKFYRDPSYDYITNCSINTSATFANAMGYDASKILVKNYLNMLLVDGLRPAPADPKLFFSLNNLVYNNPNYTLSDLQQSLISLVNVQKYSAQDPKCIADIETWVKGQFSLASDPQGTNAALSKAIYTDSTSTMANLVGQLANTIYSPTSHTVTDFTQFQNLNQLHDKNLNAAAYATDIATLATNISTLVVDTSCLKAKQADLNQSIAGIQGVVGNYVNGAATTAAQAALVTAESYADSDMRTAEAVDAFNLTAATAAINATMSTVQNSLTSLANSQNSLASSQNNLAGTVASLANSQNSLASSLASVASSQNNLAGTVASLANSQNSLASSLASVANSQNNLAGTVASLANSQNSLASSLASVASSQNNLAGTVASLTNSQNSLASSLATVASSQRAITSSLTTIAASQNAMNNSLNSQISITNSLATLANSYVASVGSISTATFTTNFNNMLLSNTSSANSNFVTAMNNALSGYGTSVSALTTTVQNNKNNIQSVENGLNNTLQLIQFMACRLGYSDISSQAASIASGLASNNTNNTIFTMTITDAATSTPPSITQVEHYYTNIYQNLLTTALAGSAAANAATINTLATSSTSETGAATGVANACQSSNISLNAGISGDWSNGGFQCWINYREAPLASGQDNSLNSVVFRVIGSADLIDMRVATYGETFGVLPHVANATNWPVQTSTGYFSAPAGNTAIDAYYGTTFANNTPLLSTGSVSDPLINGHAGLSYGITQPVPTTLATADGLSDWQNYCNPYAPNANYLATSATFKTIPNSTSSVIASSFTTASNLLYNPGGLTDPTAESFWAYLTNAAITGTGNNVSSTSVAAGKHFIQYQLEKVFNVTGRQDNATSYYIQNFVLNNPYLTQAEYQTMYNFMNADKSVAQITGNSVAGVYDLYTPSMLTNLNGGTTCKYFVFTPIRKTGGGTVTLPTANTNQVVSNYTFSRGNSVPYKVQMYSPIVFDIINQGPIQTLPKNLDFKFDIYGNGIAESTGWVSGYQGGFLVLDKNEDGNITSGQELFGQGTLLPNGMKAPNGYEALAQYDTDHKGYIDASYPIFKKLRLWFDRNQDGISQKGELMSLDELGITSISLRYDDVPQNVQVNNGNLLKYQAKYFGKNCPKDGCNTYDIYFSTTTTLSAKGQGR